MAQWQLAQFNVAKAKGPTDGPVMAEFMANLDHINALADANDGMVWRHQSESGNSTDVRAFDDPDLLLNLSVWTSLEALKEFTYRSEHLSFLRRRSEWFEPAEGLAPIVAWWVRAGHRPSIEEAVERLEKLTADGPGPEAFTFRQPFDPPNGD